MGGDPGVCRVHGRDRASFCVSLQSYRRSTQWTVMVRQGVPLPCPPSRRRLSKEVPIPREEKYILKRVPRFLCWTLIGWSLKLELEFEAKL